MSLLTKGLRLRQLQSSGVRFMSGHSMEHAIGAHAHSSRPRAFRRLCTLPHARPFTNEMKGEKKPHRLFEMAARQKFGGSLLYFLSIMRDIQ